MADRFMSITIEYGTTETNAEGEVFVVSDNSDTFDVSDRDASFESLFDDVAFEARNSLPY